MLIGRHNSPLITRQLFRVVYLQLYEIGYHLGWAYQRLNGNHEQAARAYSAAIAAVMRKKVLTGDGNYLLVISLTWGSVL